MVDAVSLSVAQLTAAAFAGICLYIGLVQHPVRMGSTAAAALDDFRAVIPRAEKVQAPLLIVCLLGIAIQVAVAPRLAVVVGGLLLLAVLVFTLVAVLPINRLLLSGSAADHLGRSPAALSRWGRRHALRTVLTVPGTVALWF